jgi:tetratricopeptide (TPR) repeat protein
MALALVAGCQQTAKQPTGKEVVTRKWNSARAAVLTGLAKDQYEGGNFDKARESIVEAEKLDGENAYIRVMSAKIAIEQAQLESAENELRMARQFDPRNAEADYLSGVIYQRWQKADLAYDFYHHASEKAPAELAYVMAKAEMLVAMDRSPEALKLLEEKVIYFEHSSTIRDAVGQLLIGQKKFIAGAEMLRQASVLAPEDSSIKEHLGFALFYAKEYDEALTVLNRLAKDEHYAKRSDVHATLGECLFEKGQFREARDSFETASKIDPSLSGIWLGLGKSALQLGDLRRAELSLKKSLSIEPDAGETNLMMGYLRLRQDRLPEALASFKKVNASDATDTLGLCMTGYVLEKLGKPDEAMQFYGRALKRNPNDELANRLMAGLQTNE